MAKQQGREMVNEARAYRERVLSELARRRELARQQIEQLMHGRDRLLQAFERSRLVAVDVMAELTPLGEPTEYVNLSPTTGPVPLMVPNQQRPAPETAEDGDDMPVAVTVVEGGDVQRSKSKSTLAPKSMVAIEVGELEAVEPPPAADDSDNTVVLDARLPRGARPRRASTTRARPRPWSPCSAPMTTTSRKRIVRRRRIVDDLFARLRAARAETVVERADRDGRRRGPSKTDRRDDDDHADDRRRPRRVSALTGGTCRRGGARRLGVRPTRCVVDTDHRHMCAQAEARAGRRTERDPAHAASQGTGAQHSTRCCRGRPNRPQRYAAAINTELDKAALLGAASIDGGTTKEHKADINRAGATQGGHRGVVDHHRRAVARATRACRHRRRRRQRGARQPSSAASIGNGRRNESTSISTTCCAQRSAAAPWPRCCQGRRSAGWSTRTVRRVRMPRTTPWPAKSPQVSRSRPATPAPRRTRDAAACSR